MIVSLCHYRERVTLLSALAELGPLAMDAYLSGDRELLADVRRWRGALLARL